MRRAAASSKNAWPALLAVALVTAADGAAWPPFLRPPETFSPGIVSAVERVWSDPTLSRSVRGQAAQVPFDVYAPFIDTPDVTAAAARHLGLAKYEVKMLDTDWYEADDHEGSRGVYRVLERAGGRRVLLSWGTNSGRFLGTVGGSALSVLDFEPSGDETEQRLQAWVLIENGVAATLARALMPIFGYLADRKLTQGFRVTAKVAAWAIAQPDEFCDWLGAEPFPSPRREVVLETWKGCQAVSASFMPHRR